MQQRIAAAHPPSTPPPQTTPPPVSQTHPRHRPFHPQGQYGPHSVRAGPHRAVDVSALSVRKVLQHKRGDGEGGGGAADAWGGHGMG